MSGEKAIAYFVEREGWGPQRDLIVHEVPIRIRPKTVVVDSDDHSTSFGIAYGYRRQMDAGRWRERHSTREKAIEAALAQTSVDLRHAEGTVSNLRTRLEEIEALR